MVPLELVCLGKKVWKEELMICKIIWVCLADDDDDDDIAFPLEENKKLQNGFKVYSTI